MTTKYSVLTVGTKTYVTSSTCAKVVRLLLSAGDAGLSYSDLVRRMRQPLGSLYVFVARLRKGHIVRTDPDDSAEVRIRLRHPERTKVVDAKAIGY